MKTSFLLLILFSSLLAPLPPAIAINPETGECGSYFGGDEYVSLDLPEPWQITYITAYTGSIPMDQYVEEYCQSNGYTYVPGNMGEIYGTYRRSALYYSIMVCKAAPFVLGGGIVLAVVLIILKRRKKRNLESRNL